MTHLKIELNNTTEYLNNDSVIRKICDIIDNNNLDKTSRLSGTIHISNLNNNAVAYDKHIDKINNDHNKCQDLTVSADNVYIWFEDPNVEAALKVCYNLTTEGVMSSLIGDANVHYMNAFLFLNSNNNNPNQYGQAITSFNELSKLTNIKTITSFLFNDCSKLRSIDLSNITTFSGNTDGDLGHFANCTSLTSLGDTTNILNLGPNAAFWKCSSLPSFTLGPLITKIPKNCFYHCTSLTTINGSPQNLQTLDNSCFEGCSSLLNININLNNLTSIGSACFKGCSSLLQISLPTNLTSIPSNCFYKCGSLTTVTGLSNITLLNLNSFDQCSNLTNINDLNWSNLTRIGPYAFNSCSNLEYTVDLSSVGGELLGQYAFNNCSKITVTNLPKSTSYGNSAFLGVKLPVNMTIPKEVGRLDWNCFKKCTLIETVLFELNSQITRIDASCFLECTSLQNIILPEGLTTVGDAAFCGCISLRYVEFPTTLTRLRVNLLFGHVNNNAGVTLCTIVFKSTVPPTLGAQNSFLWEHVFGKNNCVSNNAITNNANTIYVPDGYVSDYQSSFQSAIESSGASGTQYNKFMLFISNLIKPMSLLPST